MHPISNFMRLITNIVPQTKEIILYYAYLIHKMFLNVCPFLKQSKAVSLPSCK
jgi:hypothetical protein